MKRFDKLAAKKWHWTKFAGLFGLLLLPTLLWVGLAQAQSFRTGNDTSVAADEVVDSSLYMAGQTVDIAGEVNGDVFCAGQNITVSGKVNGDVICAGQTVHISGSVTGDVRVAGQTVTVDAQIVGSLSAASQSFSLANGSKVGRDAAVAGNDVTLNGQVGRDLAIGGAQVGLANMIGRNVTAGVENLTIRDKTRVGGDITYTSSNEAVIARGAEITGQTTWNKTKPKESKGNYGQVFTFGLGVAILVITSLLVSALVLVLLFPKIFHQSAKRALGDPLKTFLTGLLANFAMPVVIVALMMTVIGIPLGLLLMLAWTVVLAVSGAFFAYFLGRLILKKQTNPILIMLVGAAVVTVSYFIPVVGVVMLLAVMWFGTGIILRELYHRTPKPKYDLK